MRANLHGQIEDVRSIDVGIAVHHPESNELRVLQPGNHAEDPLLLAPLEPALESDQPPERPFLILLPKLDHRIGPSTRTRIDQPDRLHRPESQRLFAAPRHLLDRYAHLEVYNLHVFRVVRRRYLLLRNRLPEGVTFFLSERAVRIYA